MIPVYIHADAEESESFEYVRIRDDIIGIIREPHCIVMEYPQISSSDSHDSIVRYITYEEYIDILHTYLSYHTKMISNQQTKNYEGHQFYKHVTKNLQNIQSYVRKLSKNMSFTKSNKLQNNSNKPNNAASASDTSYNTNT